MSRLSPRAWTGSGSQPCAARSSGNADATGQQERAAGYLEPAGTELLPELRSGGADLEVGVDSPTTVLSDLAASLATEVRQILDELRLVEKVKVE